MTQCCSLLPSGDICLAHPSYCEPTILVWCHACLVCVGQYWSGCQGDGEHTSALGEESRSVLGLMVFLGGQKQKGCNIVCDVWLTPALQHRIQRGSSSSFLAVRPTEQLTDTWEIPEWSFTTWTHYWNQDRGFDHCCPNSCLCIIITARAEVFYRLGSMQLWC